MRLIFLRSSCDDWRTCPNINITDQGTYVVQGYLVTDSDPGSDVLAPDETVVEIPAALLPELASDGTPSDAFRRTERGTILVRGRAITDLIDDREVLRMHYSDDGKYVGAEVAPEEMLPRYLACKNAAWSSALDFADYWKAHPGYWRDPSAASQGTMWAT